MEPLTPPPCSKERKALKRPVPVITIDDDDENDNKEFSPAVKRDKNEATAPSIEGETPTFDKEDGEIDDETSSSESLKDEIEDELHGFIAAEVSNASSNLTIDADVELKEDVVHDAMEERSLSLDATSAGRFDALNDSEAGNNNNSNEIIKAPNFQLEPTAAGNKRLVVFASNDKTMCYKFYISQGSFHCGLCLTSHHTTVRAKVLKDENGEDFVQMIHQHLCQSVKYVPPLVRQQYETIIAPNYELQDKPNGHPKLVIFMPSDPNLCYYYNTVKKNHFVCCECMKMKKKTTSAKLLKDQYGKEYIQANVPHLCEPVPYVANKWSIIKALNFVIHQQNRKLIVFNLVHPTFCYRYNYNKSGKIYNCISCVNLHGKYISAKVIKDENGVECLQTNKNHLCDPLTYKISDVFYILKSSNFTLINNENNGSSSILRVHDSNARSTGYNFTPMGSSYACSGCLSKDKHFMAKIFLDENDEEVVLIWKNQYHVCDPITYG